MSEWKERQFLSREELYAAGYSQYGVSKLVDAGKLRPVTRRYLENMEYDGELNELYCVSAYAPKGIVCLMSAASHYGLTTARPLQIDVALPRRSRIPESPDWPKMRYYLFSDERYRCGMKTVDEDGNLYQIYDPEKTVCDILFYRNKLGFEPAVEVLKSYLNRPDRDLNRLMRYAEKLRSGKLLREYLEVMV